MTDEHAYDRTERPSHTARHHVRKAAPAASSRLETAAIVLLALVAVALAVSQVQLAGVFSSVSTTDQASGAAGPVSLANVDISSVGSTAQAIATVFPQLKGVTGEQEVMNILIPTGTPDYGQALGVSFDQPEQAEAKLANMFPSLEAEVKKDDPEAYQRWLSMASSPMGMSCEFCCGVGPVAADKNGQLLCGCQHIPALNAVGLWLAANTHYSNAQILHEVLRWKALFFPQDMVKLGMQVVGKDPSQVQAALPQQVGGC